MAYPIKYIETISSGIKTGNVMLTMSLFLTITHFLSPEQKIQVHDSFRQLIAQNRDGKIHAFTNQYRIQHTFCTRAFQNEVTGKLKAVAYDKIDQQTDALISMIGENQVNYRFFIGLSCFSTIRSFFYEKSYR